MTGSRLYFRYAAVNLKGMLQYRMWPLQIGTSILNTVWDFIAVIVLYVRFGALGDWSAEFTLFVFGIGTASFGLAELFARGLDVFPWYIKTGAFDRILLRPRATMLQALGERFQLDRCGRALVGLGCVVVASVRLGIEWEVWSVAMIALSLIAGWFLYTGVFTIFAAVAFWTIGPVQVIYMFTNHTLQYLKIPFGSFGRWIRRSLTFVFPLATFTYFPVMSVTGYSDARLLGFAALPACAAFFCLALLVWRFGVRHYHSTGT